MIKNKNVTYNRGEQEISRDNFLLKNLQIYVLDVLGSQVNKSNRPTKQ